MKGKIINDWGKIDFSRRDDVEKMRGAFQYFMSAIGTEPSLKAAYQAFTSTGNFPTEVLQVLEKFHAVGDFDTGYEQIFDIRDFTNTSESGFEIADVSSGLTFEKLSDGQKIKVFKMSGSKVSVSFDEYGGALGWMKHWFDDNKFWQIEDTAIEFRNKAYAERAKAFYALIEALGAGTDIAWVAPTPSTLANTSIDYTVSRDVNTIQAACDAILSSVKDKGYGVTANSPFKLLAPNVLKPRINAALTRLNQPVAGSSMSVAYNVQPIYTLMLTSNSDYYVALPGKKLKGGYRQDLTLSPFTDVLARAEIVAGVMRHGGAVGDTDQLRRCKTS